MLRLRVYRIPPYSSPGGWAYEIRDTSRPENHQILCIAFAWNWRHALREGLDDLKRASQRTKR